MVQKMIMENVLPFLTMFLCFFTLTFSWLWGIYSGINNFPQVANTRPGGAGYEGCEGCEGFERCEGCEGACGTCERFRRV